VDPLADKIKAALNDMKRVQSMYRITQTPIQNNQLQEGIQKCVTNSVRLLEDSKLLMKNKRFLSAIVLASLSLEECGKGVILLDRLKAGQDVGSTSWETLFENHDAKLRAPARFGKLIGVKPKGKNFERTIDVWGKSRLQRRITALYVYWNLGHWFSPTDAPTADLRQEIAFDLHTTEFFVDRLKRTEKELRTKSTSRSKAA